MIQNCQEIISDVVRIYPLCHGVFSFPFPATVKMTTLMQSALLLVENPQGLSFEEYLRTHLFFAITGAGAEARAERDIKTSPTADNVPHVVTMEENPTLKTSGKSSVTGLIQAATLTILVKHPSQREIVDMSEMADNKNFDYLLEVADGRRFLLRALPGTSNVVMETDVQKDCTYRLKCTLKSLSTLIPLI